MFISIVNIYLVELVDGKEKLKFVLSRNVKHLLFMKRLNGSVKQTSN